MEWTRAIRNVRGLVLAVPAAAITTGAHDQLILYVSQDTDGANTGTSWADAYQCLQDALDHARAANVDGDPATDVSQIWIAQGTYTPDRGTGDRRMTFALVEGVALFGGFAGDEPSLELRDWVLNPTVLSGDLNGDDGPNFENRTDNSCHVVTAGNPHVTPPIAPVTAATILDGLTIRGGHAVCRDVANSLDYGGGLYSFGGSPTIRNLSFEENYALTGGGGIYLSGASPLVEHCAFIGNMAELYGGAVGAFAGSKPAFSDCLFTENFSGFVGAGIYLTDVGTFLTAMACQFEDNFAASGAGITATTQGGFDVQFSSFINNVAAGVAGAIRTNVHAESVVEHCVFRGNVSGIGGGAMRISTDFSNMAKVNVRNCRFLENIATGSGFGGAIYAVNWKGDFINNIVAGNSGAFAAALNIVNSASGGGAQFAPRLINCTLAGNAGGPAISVQKALPRIWNSIVWHGEIQPIVTIDGASIMLDHCNVATAGFAWAGSNNIAVEPQFSDPVAEDYRLLAGCASIDAGSNALVPARVTTDVNGDPRIQDGDTDGLAIVNIGATETVVVPTAVCAGDLNGDGLVNVFDLLELLAAWGPVVRGRTDGADLDESGAVNVFDLLILLAAWGPCPADS